MQVRNCRTVQVKSRTPPQHSVASEYVLLSAVSRPGGSPNSSAGTPQGLRVTKVEHGTAAGAGDGEAKGLALLTVLALAGPAWPQAETQI